MAPLSELRELWAILLTSGNSGTQAGIGGNSHSRSALPGRPQRTAHSQLPAEPPKPSWHASAWNCTCLKVRFCGMQIIFQEKKDSKTKTKKIAHPSQSLFSGQKELG